MKKPGSDFYPTPTADFLKRFWSKVQKGPACWLWVAATNSTGYGVMSIGGRLNLAAHRIAWRIHNGDIPESLQVLHTCDTRNCVNPKHLYLGTPQQNTRDMWERKRSAHQTKRFQGHVLNGVDALFIRDVYNGVPITRDRLANYYQVSPQTIDRVISGAGKHVERAQKILTTPDPVERKYWP